MIYWDGLIDVRQLIWLVKLVAIVRNCTAIYLDDDWDDDWDDILH